ncbi:lytic transglycosylase domain-containing protein [Burkholderia sp. B21-005]|uniref:lytic transglycosylase domain-containing protein n=1 Tax=Burkholderia sp. B21-005 TaxID=2890406 RepID=UPI001E28FFDC|nr:lytic transglycosylase domain-containing protein [Burkholderia sp. B21-005]UEP43137.1 lytic transglycosylase domain-containing protein [Burkholderia sp. B21-005]
MMAGASPFVLPQFQGSLYDLQRQQALANALMERSLTPQQVAPGAAVGPYQVQARMSPLVPISQIGQALLSAKMGSQAGQGLNDLGQQQWGTLTSMLGGGAGMQSPQLNPGSADASGAGADAIAGNAGGNGGAVANAGPAVPGNASGAGGGNGGVGSSPLNPLGMNPGMAAMMMMQSPDKYWESQAAAYKPAEIVQQIRAAGIDPSSALGRQIAQQALAKSNYIAPTSLRPGGYMYDPMSGTMQQMPNVPEGFTAMRGPNGQWQIVPVQGALEAMGASAAAKAGGTAQYQLKEVWDPNANGGQGGYVQQSVSNVANAANGGGMRGVPSGGLAGIFAQQESNGGKTAPDNPFQIQQGTFNQYAQKGESWNNVADRNTVAQRVLNTYNDRYGGDLGRIATAYFSGEGNVAPAGSPTPFLRNVSDRNGKSVASYVGDILGRAGGGSPQSGPMASQPQAGYTKGQEDLQGDLTKKWGSLNEANSQAQNTISYLQNIHDLASKAALGQQSDKLNYINGLLSLAGSEKATNMVTANNLLDKYSNQIVARLGTGGLGTDAARAILQSAYPNAHMTKGAIDEAVQNLVGASQMTQAKARLLQGDYNSRNPQAYNQKEMVFDQNADPRIWQYKNISDPNARKAFAKEVLQQDPNFGSKIKALESIGAL